VGVQTDGAADAKQVYVPAPYEQGVRRAHRTSITRSCTACPSGPRHGGDRTRGTLVWHHVRANVCIRRAYSAPLENTKNVTGSRFPGLRGLGRPPGPMALLSAGQPCSARFSPGQRRSARVSAGQPGSAPVSPGQRRSARVSPGQRRSARVSPGGSRPPAARSHGAEGAGNHTRCRRGSRRDGAPGTERRSCAYLLAISAHRQEEVRAAARS
jgi:hypothetical protein